MQTYKAYQEYMQALGISSCKNWSRHQACQSSGRQCV